MKRALFLVGLLLGCDGRTNESGLDQPFRVRGAQLVEGPLPGLPASSPDATPGARVSIVELANTVIFPGQAQKRVGGRATKGASTVAMRFADLGTGFYRFVVEGPDPAAGGEATWNATLDFSRDVPSGLHVLQLVAFDGNGQPGVQREVKVCVAGAVPDNLSACDPSIAAPAAVLSLEWDTNVDLDLQLLTPEGKLVDAKHPTTAPVVDGGIDKAALADPRTGRLDRDSNAYCGIDGLRRESIVFQGAPAPGTYLVYANLFDACGQASVRFNASLWLAEPRVDVNDSGSVGTRLVKKLETGGQLLGVAANGGRTTGLYLTDVTFE